jgi:hypothetical protein
VPHEHFDFSSPPHPLPRCSSFGPTREHGKALIVLSYTNGGVVSVSDVTRVYSDGTVYTHDRIIFGRNMARRDRLSRSVVEELRRVLTDPEVIDPLVASNDQRCGTLEEDTVSVSLFIAGAQTMFCSNVKDVAPVISRLLGRLEAPLIRALGAQYTTRLSARTESSGGT